MSLTPIVPGSYAQGAYELTQSGAYEFIGGDGSGPGSLLLQADSGVAAGVIYDLPTYSVPSFITITADQSGSSLAFEPTGAGSEVQLTAAISNGATVVLDPIGQNTGVTDFITMSGLGNLVFADPSSVEDTGVLTLSGVDNNLFFNGGAVNFDFDEKLSNGDASLSGDNLWVQGATSVSTSENHRGLPVLTTFLFSNGTSFVTQVPPTSSFQVIGNYGVLSFGDGASFLTCFLRGSMIRTQDGERAVERLAEGDMVVVRQVDGSLTTQAVRWVGCGARRTSPHEDDDAFPVRIRADAFADGVPSRDLLVTPEHCIFVEGCLIPARMLVNGGSILFDRSFRSYEYFHVELDQHAILIANGLETESYLDTGNRAGFASAGCPGTSLKPDDGILPVAPIITDRAAAEAIWRGLQGRSIGLGYRAARGQLATTSEPDLRLLLASGECLIPQVGPDGPCFVLRRGQRPVALLSRSISPARSIGPFVDDRRALGVAVERVCYRCKALGFEITAAALVGRGWHGLEGDFRWTDGHAELSLPAAPADGTVVAVRVVGTMLYSDEGVRLCIAAA